MEVMIFCTVIGLLMAGTFVLIGVCIGKADDHYHQKHNKDNRADVRDTDNHSLVLHSGTCDCGISSLGDVHREEHCRCSVGYLHEVNNECLAAFLRAFLVTSAHLTPGEKDHFIEIINRLEGEYEDND